MGPMLGHHQYFNLCPSTLSGISYTQHSRRFHDNCFCSCLETMSFLPESVMTRWQALEATTSSTAVSALIPPCTAGCVRNINLTRLSNGSLQVTDLRSGSPDGTDTVSNVELFQFADMTFAPTADRAPVVTTSNFTAAHGQSSVAASSLFAAGDPDGDNITKYAFWDSGSSGHWVVNGVTQAIQRRDRCHGGAAGANQLSVWSSHRAALRACL